MSNKASNQVHELIHSLTPAEKRYFRLFAERHSSSGKNNYQLLFEAIEKQNVYDEKLLLKRFQNQAFTKHFSIAKNRLYHQILKSLDLYHSESSSEATIRNYLHYAEILFQKNLHNQCARLISSAEKIAEKHENYLALLKVLDWKKKLVETKNYETNETEISKKQGAYLEKLSIEKECWQIKSEVFRDLFRSGQIRSKEKAEGALKIIDQLNEKKSRALDFESQYLILHTKGAIYFNLARYEECHACLNELKELFEEKLHFAKDNPLSYHSVLINLAYVSAKLNKISHAQNLLEQSRELDLTLKISSTPYLKFRIFTDSYGLELAIANLTADITRGKMLLEVVPPGLKKWQNQLSEVKKAAFLHELSVMHLLLQDPKEALKWNNELLNTVSMDKSEDQVLFAHMFHAVLQMERENFELLPNIEKSLKRFLEVRDKRYAFETHFLELIRSIRSKNHMKTDFRVFLSAIRPLEKQSFEKIAFEYFDFVAWAESKIGADSLAERVEARISVRDVL